jgi:hypothetical protein
MVISDIYEIEESHERMPREILKIMAGIFNTYKRIRFKFSLESFEEFLEYWKGKHELSIITSDFDYEENIRKYKNNGTLKILGVRNVFL